MRNPVGRTAVLMLLPALLASCGEEPEETLRTSSFVDAEDPWAQVPQDSLYGATAPENVTVVPLVVDVPDLPAGWNGARIAVISDLQLDRWEGNPEVAAAAIRRAVEERADVVALIGDFITRSDSAQALEAILPPLRGRAAVAVLGRRDARTDSLEARVEDVLQRGGVRVLENARTGFVRGGDTLQIAGIDGELLSESAADQKWIATTLQGGTTPLLLVASPTVIGNIPDDYFPLVVAGNTFCGQVDVPGSPRLSWWTGEGLQLEPYRVGESDRLFRVSGNGLVLTCGIGHSYVPVRFGSPPEILMITLRRAGAPVAAAPDTAAQAGASAADSLLLDYEQRQDSAARAATPPAN